MSTILARNDDGQAEALAGQATPSTTLPREVMTPEPGFVSSVKPNPQENAPENDGWPPRLELPAMAAAVPALSPKLIPEAFQRWLVDASERACVPLEFMVVAALTALSSLVGRSLAICPKQHDNWTVIPNLFGMIVGNPSIGKSPALGEGTSPLKHLAVKAHEAFEKHEAEREAEITIVKMKMERLKREAAGKNADPDAIQAQLVDLNKRLKELEREGKERRYLTNDATIEKLADLLVHNPRGLLVLRDELSGLLTSFSKSGRESDRAFYLEAWSGLEAHSVDRVGRGSIYVPAVVLGVLGGIQPARLMAYMYGALRGEEDADGFLQRFQLLVWPDQLREWKNVDRAPDHEARRRAFAVFERIDTLDVTTLSEVEEGDPPALRFTVEAQRLFDSWREGLMRRIRSPEFDATPAFQSHLAKYPSLFASLALLAHLIQVVDGQAVGKVSLGAAQLALDWCNFLEAHARKVYAPELNTTVLAAQLLGEKVEQGHIEDGQTVREIYRRQWTGLKTPEQVEVALKVLEQCHWLRVETVDSGKSGGRPSEILHLHPELRKAA